MTKLLSVVAALLASAAAATAAGSLWELPETAEPFWVTQFEATRITGRNCGDNAGRGEVRFVPFASFADQATFQRYACTRFGEHPGRRVRFSFYRDGDRILVQQVRAFDADDVLDEGR